ncbi:unnamed protein product [Rhizophagus irregularis]|nr:unnamed protein product [Rhizophagus irregularis]
MSKETKRESINDNLEMILSCEQVRKLLSKFSFDYYEIRLWKDQIEIPIGVSMEPFVIREVILYGLYFQHLKLYLEFECKKGQIPSWVNERAGDQTTMLEPLKIKPNQRFLYHGVRTSIIIPFFIAYARPYSNAINNEFGPGIYCTPNFDVAVEYSGRNGAIFIYDWSDSGGDSITTKTLSGKEWADTVKGHICIADITRPSPPLHEEDIIQGPITIK